MASWNSTPTEVTYEVLGRIAFVSWVHQLLPSSCHEFPEEKVTSVVGLNFDFVLLNLTKHSSYLIYNATLYFSSAVQKHYFHKYGSKQMIPVAANDVAFSTHAVLLTVLTLIQIAIYEVILYFAWKSEAVEDFYCQKLSKISIEIVVIVWLGAAVCFFIALSNHSWLWLISVFNLIQVGMTVIKYIPQAIMNFMRKSTDGFSIGNILLDFTGGLTSYAQLAVKSVDQHSWVNFDGNIGKTLLSLISIFFDLLFMCQHFLLYPPKKARQVRPNSSTSEERTGPIGKSPDHHYHRNI